MLKFSRNFKQTVINLLQQLLVRYVKWITRDKLLRVLQPKMEKTGTLGQKWRPNGDPNTQKGPLGTRLGTVTWLRENEHCKQQQTRQQNQEGNDEKCNKYAFLSPFTIKQKALIYNRDMTSRGPWTLCDGPQTLTHWKSVSVTYQPTDQSTDLPTYLLGQVQEMLEHLRIASPNKMKAFYPYATKYQFLC